MSGALRRGNGGHRNGGIGDHRRERVRLDSAAKHDVCRRNTERELLGAMAATLAITALMVPKLEPMGSLHARIGGSASVLIVLIAIVAGCAVALISLSDAQSTGHRR